jgi:hypothetical protein
MVWLIVKKPKEKTWVWTGPGRPGPMDLPPDMPAEQVETRRLMAKYDPSFGTPYDQAKHRSFTKTTLDREFRAPKGSGWLIKPKEVEAEEREAGEETDNEVDLHDLGTSFVFEIKATPEDLRGVKMEVTIDSVAVFIPAGNDWLKWNIRGRDRAGNRLGRIHFHDDVVPNQSWADLWDGVLRIHMPVDTNYFYDGVSNKLIEPVVRNEPPPLLPEVPIEQQNKPSIYELRVEDRGDTLEFVMTVEDQVRESFRYEVEPQVLKIFFEEGRKKTSDKGVGIRVKQHQLLIDLRDPVLVESANYDLQGNTFYIWLHKA